MKKFFISILSISLMLSLVSCGLFPTPALVKVGTGTPNAQPTAPNPNATASNPVIVTTSASEPLAKLAEVTANVYVSEADGKNRHLAVVGESLFVSYEINTDSNGRAKLFFADGTTVRLAPSTNFVITARSKDATGAWYTKTLLTLGQVWIALNGGSFDVETPVGVGAVKGSDLWVKIIIGADGKLVFTAGCVSGTCTIRDRVTGAVLGQVPVGQTINVLDKFTPSNFVTTTMTKALLDEWILNNPGPQNVLLVQAAARAAGITDYVPPAAGGTIPSSP